MKIATPSARRGDALTDDVVEGLYRRHFGAAVQFAYILTGDASEAQDHAQEAFIRAAGRVRNLRDPDLFAAYLRRTLVRTVAMSARSRQRERARAERVAPAVVGSDAAGGVDTHLDLIDALRSLPPRQRAALVLRFWYDLPEVEIGRALRCRPGTVKSTISRGLAALRQEVRNDE